MTVYIVVVYRSIIGMEIEKVFLSKDNAEKYIKKQPPCLLMKILEYNIADNK